MQTLNVIDTAIRSGVFQTFTRLLEGSQLEANLRGAGWFTLFAPVDVSFAYLPPETLRLLLQAENQGVLADVLGYHAVPRKILSEELRNLNKESTVSGLDLTFESDNELSVGGAKLLHLDILACNGVIHGIDRLLMPVKLAATSSR